MKEYDKMLFEAVEENNLIAVDEALKNGADANSLDRESGNTILTAAVCVGNVEVIQKLADFGADLNKLNENGYSPLMLASRWGDANVVQKLIECGANVNTANHGITALTIAIGCRRNEVVDILIKNKATQTNLSKEVEDKEKTSGAETKPSLVKSSAYGDSFVVAGLERSYN